SIALVAVAAAFVPVTADAAARKGTVAKKAEPRRVHRSFSIAKHSSVMRAAIPAKPSFGELAGLHQTADELALRSSVALVMDQDTREILLRKNDSAVLPIASITKLMTGVVVSEAKLPMDERVTITKDDGETAKH